MQAKKGKTAKKVSPNYFLETAQSYIHPSLREKIKKKHCITRHFLMLEVLQLFSHYFSHCLNSANEYPNF
jgi:hypothetical protein